MNVHIETDPTLTAQVIPPPDVSLLVILTLFLIATFLVALLLYVLHRKSYKNIRSQQAMLPVLEDHPAIARLRARLKSS